MNRALIAAIGSYINEEVRALRDEIKGRDRAGELLRALNGLQIDAGVREVRDWTRALSHNRSVVVRSWGEAPPWAGALDAPD